MSQEVKEKISSFYDDELDASDHDHVITHLKSNLDIQNTWRRYGLIGDALKKNLPDNLEHNLFSRIQVAMESEPTHLSVAADQNVRSMVKNADVVEISRKSPKDKDKGFHHPAFGFGIAATVALVSVLGFQMFSSSPEMPLQTEIASTPPTAFTQELNIVSSDELTVPEISVTEEATASSRVFAEQSIIDDGQWTRITPMDSASLESELLLGKPESRVNIDLQNRVLPLARSVSMENSTTE